MKVNSKIEGHTSCKEIDGFNLHTSGENVKFADVDLFSKFGPLESGVVRES